MEIILTDRHETVLDSNMSLLEKIGTMAKLCYRVENPNDPNVNARIVKNCIKEGHESVLEHGVISLYLKQEPNEDSKLWSEHIGLAQNASIYTLYGGIQTNAMKKYTEHFRDPDIYPTICKRRGEETDEKQTIPIPVQIGNVRAWRQVIRERLFIATGVNGDKYQLAMVVKMLHEFYNLEDGNVLFGDLYDNVNEILTFEDVRNMIFDGNVPEDLGTFGIEEMCKRFFAEPDSVIAAPASPTASLSVIFTTDRAMTHQFVRHRANVGYSQESQRYVNYDKKGYRVIPLTVDPNKYPADFFDNIELGRVRSTSNAYKEWFKAMEDAFTHYYNLLHIYDDETGHSDLKLPPETCRGALPNDTATRIGVTWMSTSGFLNMLFWRIDSHAQYVIRSAMARLFVKIAVEHHPFIMSIPINTTIHYLNMIREQKLVDPEAVSDVIKSYGMLAAQIDKLREELSKRVSEAK